MSPATERPSPQQAILATPPEGLAQLAKLIKGQADTKDVFTEEALRSVEAEVFDQKLSDLPDGVDQEKYRYRWDHPIPSLIRDYAEGRHESWLGVPWLVVTRQNHPDIPDHEFGDTGGIIHRRWQQILLFADRRAVTKYLKVWNDRYHANMIKPKEVGPEKPVKEIETTPGEAKGSLMGVQPAADDDLAAVLAAKRK